MSRLLSSFMYVAACLTLLVSTAWASTEKRVALVIGNQNYETTTPLKNPINDATAIAGKLESMGFEVVQGMDLTYDSLRDTVRGFTRTARDADVTLFYYAGHGIAVDGENYIVPTDAKLNDPYDWEFEVYNVAEILRLVDRSPGPSLVFLDACRDNPLADILAQAQGMSSRSLNNRGLSRIPTDSLGTSGSVIAYATEPGQVAADGSGDNSPFALALMKHIGTANTDFASVTSLITREVMEMTDGKQRPRFDVSLTGPLLLNEIEFQAQEVEDQEVASLDATTPAPAPSVNTAAVEQIMFETALGSNDKADFEAFLDAFPKSTFAPLARNAINRIEGDAKKEAQETEVASLGTQAQQTSVARVVNAPLALPLTPAAIALASSDTSEKAMTLSKTQRKEVQLRLNLAGHSVGTPDGDIGPNSRNGIRSWQAVSGFAATGYLNLVQHQFLVAGTQTAFVAHMAANPSALATPKKTVRKKTSGSRKTSSNARKKRGNGQFWSGVAAGAAGALLLKK